MSAFKAGLLAWTIELAVAFLMLLGLKHEDNKVVRRRKKSVQSTKD